MGMFNLQDFFEEDDEYNCVFWDEKDSLSGSYFFKMAKRIEELRRKKVENKNKKDFNDVYVYLPLRYPPGSNPPGLD